MTACGSLQQIFESPLPDNPTLIESLSPWNHIKTMKPIEDSSFTEIFGELHFKENPESSSSSPLSLPFPASSSSSSSLLIDVNPQPEIEKFEDNSNAHSNENKKNSSLESLLGTQKNKYMGCPKNGDGFSSKNLESLQHCTEGLGFESSDDVEDSKNENGDGWKTNEKEKVSIMKLSSLDNLGGEFKRSRTSIRSFPPPISSIGRSGKPWVCFRSYRHDGRFVLKEIRIPNQEFLHACRQDGRLKLHFGQPDEAISEDEEEEEEKGEEQEEVNEEKDDADEREDEEGKK